VVRRRREVLLSGAAASYARMRIDFRMDGGLAAFPGLAKPVSIACEALPPVQAARLRALVERAGFFSLSSEPSTAVAPDARAYTIGVDDAGRCRTVTVTEPIADDALRDLVAELRVHADAQRRQRR
jgi:hypothetical protein